jgi:hypothetical protein
MKIKRREFQRLTEELDYRRRVCAMHIILDSPHGEIVNLQVEDLYNISVLRGNTAQASDYITGPVQFKMERHDHG